MDVIILVASIASIYFAGRMTERRGRSFRTWAWVGALIGPLAFALVLLFPNLRGKNGEHA